MNTGTASILALLPFTRRFGLAWDMCSLEDIRPNVVTDEPLSRDESAPESESPESESPKSGPLDSIPINRPEYYGSVCEAPAESVHPIIPSKLYTMLSTTAQAHLLSSPLHPVPLIPVVCVADHENIIPLLCSALHQRKVLGHQDFPVLGLFRHPQDSDVFQVVIGWLEESSAEATSTVRPASAMCGPPSLTVILVVSASDRDRF
ncbi:hypothetical protein LXA43DRAFT_1098239 [Ganoderma leucocontextum]|nr:hypothetical protein LXA43DRAFT_1098239 [Ganoderma leucocontextum]